MWVLEMKSLRFSIQQEVFSPRRGIFCGMGAFSPILGHILLGEDLPAQIMAFSLMVCSPGKDIFLALRVPAYVEIFCVEGLIFEYHAFFLFQKTY